MKNLLIPLLLFLSSFTFSQQSLELCDDDTTKIFTYSTDAGIPGYYEWSIDGGVSVIDGPSYSVVWGLYGEGNHTISVSFTDDAGCSSDEIDLTVFVEICQTSSMWVPNCFTPDGDENNNIWLPIGSNYSEPYYFIVNRWGETVFESYDLSIGWDGTYNGKMCTDGVYVYVIKWKDYEGSIQQKHGHITLVR